MPGIGLKLGLGRIVPAGTATGGLPSLTRHTLGSVLAKLLIFCIRASNSCALLVTSLKLASCSRASACFVASFIAITRAISGSSPLSSPSVLVTSNDKRNSGGNINTGALSVPAPEYQLGTGHALGAGCDGKVDNAPAICLQLVKDPCDSAFPNAACKSGPKCSPRGSTTPSSPKAGMRAGNISPTRT